MKAPLYKDDGASRHIAAAGNLGLYYTRFFDRYDDAWGLDESAKHAWIGKALRDPDPSLSRGTESYARRQIDLMHALDAAVGEKETCWHFATGLGLPHPVENGLAWHPTLGLPYLKATGVKGLLAAWLDLVRRDEDRTETERQQAERRIERWCGTQKCAGSLIFFDAVPTKPPILACDVMTPHMGRWYADGASLQSVNGEPEKVPADWHSPIPIPFLVVRQGSFLFGIAPRPGADHGGRNSTDEARAALDSLTEALEVLGAGAKTAVGYGRFEAKSSGLLADIDAEKAEFVLQDANARIRAAKLSPFAGFDPPIESILGDHDLEGLTTIVLKAIDTSTWSADDTRQIAIRLEAWMRDNGEWIDDARKKVKKANRNRRIRNSLRVMDLLGRP